MANVPHTGFAASVQDAMDNTSEEQKDPFWIHADHIDSARWNQSFPYQILLVTKQGSAYVADPQWTFTLPISPEAISFSMPFAIGGHVQLDGYHEEHGGAPIRMISFNGTTGVMPLKGSADVKTTDSLGTAIFGGTVQNATRIKTAATDLSNDLTGQLTKTNTIQDEDLPDIIKGSGYYQFRLLQQWFENYAAYKKTKKGASSRMALAIWKDEAVYLVTPTGFNVPRNAGSPYEYPYNLSFKAWRRIKLSSSFNKSTDAFVPVVRDANKLGTMLKAIDDARRVLETLRDTIAAIAGDLDHALFEPLRELSLFAKDLLGVPVSLIDLPVQIIRDAKSAIITAISVRQAASGISQAYNNGNAQLKAQIDQIAALGASSSKAQTKDGDLVGKNQAMLAANTTDPGNDPFNDPLANYALFSSIQLGQVNLPPALVRAVLTERERIRQLKRLDFEQRRDTLVQLAADFADAVGAGNATFTKTYNRQTKVTTRKPTSTDFQAMYAMNRVIMELNRLAASGTTNQFQVTGIQYMAGLATRSGMAFTTPRSKYAVPFPYATTIEQLATRYLGSPDRWIEIVALNGLRAPYVDEVGFDLTLLTNGRGNEVIVADSFNLFVGQSIWLSSNTTSRTQRRITKIHKLNESQSTVTVDGDSDLERFSTEADAYLHAFLPDTVNSMQQIYIPSDIEPADTDYMTKSIPGLNQFDPLLEAGGVDLLLTDSGDLAITPDGDCRLAVGLQNIIQKARTRLSVLQGTLNRHPEYGISIKAGESTADVDATALLASVRTLFTDDPSFTGVKAVNIVKSGNYTTIAMQLGVAGVSSFIPVTFNVKS